MRILIATPLYPPDDGGPATYSRTLEMALPKQGIEVSIVSFSHFRKYPKGISHLLYYFALKREAKRCDLIFALDPVSVGFPAMYASKRTGKPLVLKMVGDYAWEQGKQRFGVKENLDEFVKLSEGEVSKAYPKLIRLWRTERDVASHAKVIIVPSAYLQGVMVQWGTDSSKIQIIYNSFKPNLPKESKSELRQQFGYTENDLVVISVGRFVPWKGFEKLMDAMSDVIKSLREMDSNKNKKIILQLVGSGDSSSYESHAKKMGYDFVHFLGLVDYKELMKRIKAADCFALNTEYEGLSHVILEAMALETPVVTTDVGGNPELFASHSKQALAPYNNVEELHNRILLLLADKKSAINTAKSASNFVGKFTEEHMITATIALLQTIH